MRRLLVAVVACVAAASALVLTAVGVAPVASKASATIVYGFNGKDAEGRIVNLTPYPWTFVSKSANHWVSAFSATLQPGQEFVYRLQPYNDYATTQEYSGWFTYRADTLDHHEFLTVTLSGSHCTGICLPRDGPALSVSVWNGTRALNVDKFGRVDYGPKTPNPEIGWTASGNANVWPGQDAPFDFTFQTKGNYTVDAAKAPPQLADLLDAMCAGASGTKCSFTQIGDIRWGIGALDQQTSIKSCHISDGRRSRTAVVGGGGAPPPNDSPDWHEVTVEAKRTRSVSFGGSITASTELNLFDTIDTEVSVKIGAEHEWADTTTFSKTTRVYVPQGWLAGVWVAPVLGKVTGTLVVSTALASYTITNFEETASGVSKDLTTPAFDIMTYSRPMTAEEIQRLCPQAASADRRAPVRS
jgi:hypothetical protein